MPFKSGMPGSISFSQNKFVHVIRSSPVIRKYCFPKGQDAGHSLHGAAKRVGRWQLRPFAEPIFGTENPLCHHH